jgi:transposase
MMGQLSNGQERLFYSFNIEDHIPANHLLRSIDRCLDLSDVRHYLADFYSPIGRPSIDPELMIRLLVVGYCYGIRSERRLCEEAHLNLAYRWFCRLSLEDEVPNHPTFSKNRHGRFRDSSLFRWLFNEVLRRCMDAGLVKGEGFAVDASVIKADASRQRGVPGDEEINWRGVSSHRRRVFPPYRRGGSGPATGWLARRWRNRLRFVCIATLGFSPSPIALKLSFATCSI